MGIKLIRWELLLGDHDKCVILLYTFAPTIILCEHIKLTCQRPWSPLASSPDRDSQTSILIGHTSVSDRNTIQGRE